MKIRRRIAMILLVSLVMTSACASSKEKDHAGPEILQDPSGETLAESGSVQGDRDIRPADIEGRPFLVRELGTAGAEGVTPNVEPYVLEADLSNVENLAQFYFYDENMIAKLAENGFVVCGEAGREFFEVYENNRYSQRPNFVTVDSMMHTYHLYFSHLLKSVEREYLADALAELSGNMLATSIGQYESLKGSEWESAAKRNVAFFTVGAKLLNEDTAVEDYVRDMVEFELDHIGSAEGIEESRVTGDLEDYTQYIPRGYYEGDAKLEKYFRAMMWYGRIHFRQDSEDMDRSALLIAKALADDAETYGIWESVYAVTSFFVGASDDLGVCEYAPVMQEVYGETFAVEDLIGNTEAFAEFRLKAAALKAPQINSIPIFDGQENVIPGFRFMGQRFTIDAAVMQQLVYSKVQADTSGGLRMLPDVLDVPAALGSDLALSILREQGDTEYEGYMENMDSLRQGLARENETLWSASLYANWLNTLRPLLEVKGEGYPTFMQSGEWLKKDLECFAGSFTELKHDTVLYSKQVMAEMGGDYDLEIDDRGYVEPEPVVYARFAALADLTAQGLEDYGMVSAADKENLALLSELAGQLMVISDKELREETLTDEEYELIKGYGGNIEHFWYEVMTADDSDAIYTEGYSSALVVDIATDPNGSVLEAATGHPSEIYVVVRVDGKLKIARGSVYSFYQFEWPMDQRMTDSEWRVMMGYQADEEGMYRSGEQPVAKPDWTGSYRHRYEWE
ncbi:MAG: DUF3160 domain-containing protein [Clostridium sp.]|nr:DUF3160 domain-containing protein [Acetatifactor muris]MCM1527247.1 DUF3160 domain-containing protein [Bacteroides sp.]MCM1563058.1 DUF3160 domain-containing protein [Clostridium sp.]